MYFRVRPGFDDVAPLVKLPGSALLFRVALSRVLNGRPGVSSDLALRLERAGAGTARAWLAMQANYDLAQAMAREQPPVRPLDDRAA
ncbi:HigA family addiction module antidote protein [Agrobacterium larrymoorei]|nr:HigA family addiction module antidote protein [Agrobacterium larrymoorei]